MERIELHIITNCIKAAPSTMFIEFAYKSFIKAFGDMPVVVWCDPHPKQEAYEDYKKALIGLGFNDIRKTSSLAESYMGVIEQCQTRFAFVLEHDWVFCHDRIKHSIDEILLLMEREGLYYFRFNQISNYVRGWDRVLKEKNSQGFKYLESNCWSGNPHILDVEKCRDLGIVDRIKNRDKRTPEKRLTDDPELVGHIYGPLNYPEVIIHFDGRGNTPKPHWTPRQKRLMAGKRLHRIIRVSVCVPWLTIGDQWREKAKAFVEAHYSEYPYFYGSSKSRPFNRSAAINFAADAATRTDPELEVLFIVDADTYVPMSQVRIACALAKAENRAVLPYTQYLRLDQAATKNRLKHGDMTSGKKVTGHVSGALAVPVSLFKEVGGFDERFSGWGGEDRAFYFACQAISGHQEGLRVPGNAYHFYHPQVKERSKEAPGYQENISLALRYKKAAGVRQKTGVLPPVDVDGPDVDKLLKIMSEPGGPYDPRLISSGIGG